MASVTTVLDPPRTQITTSVSQMSTLLECPVCGNYALPPIMQCENGHHLCAPCRKNVAMCPVCRAPKGNNRNLALEKLAESTLFPCKYRSKGCTTSLLIAEKKRHENSCERGRERGRDGDELPARRGLLLGGAADVPGPRLRRYAQEEEQQGLEEPLLWRRTARRVERGGATLPVPVRTARCRTPALVVSQDPEPALAGRHRPERRRPGVGHEHGRAPLQWRRPHHGRHRQRRPILAR
ncbi:uncharacterized protein LOC119183261 isoform X2 [Rhipicephalus microplus]|uniref:uncharacterized protein LOC119183261 isoform X2 n=1 Tax=Rhipicephalus microplus TaxID=6941 RepID=UPI003F6AF0D6